jgi:hypothetical protein
VVRLFTDELPFVNVVVDDEMLFDLCGTDSVIGTGSEFDATNKQLSLEY